MKRLFLAIMLTASAAAYATDVTTSAAGTLQSVLDAEPSTVTTLSVSGPINASDLHFIAALPSITTLDLSKASIVEETNSRLATNHSAYKADQLPAYILAGGKFSTVILPASLVEIGDGALMSTAITSVTIPASVKKIGRGALADCRNLKQLTVPSTVTVAGSHMCDGDVALSAVTFGPGEVPAYAFRGCTSLSGFEGSPAVIGDYAFAGCTALKAFTFPAGLASTGTGAFYNTGLYTADLGACRKLNTLGDYMFAHCAALTSVRLPEGLKTIGEGAFFADDALKALNIPSTVTSLDDFSLKGTRALDSSTGLLSDGVNSIGRYGMAGMESLKSVMIPDALASIDDYGMAGMQSLQSIDARRATEVPATGTAVWDGVDGSKVNLYVNPSMENSFLAAGQWNEFNIVSAGIEQIEADAAGTAPSINLAIQGTDLVISADTAIGSAAVFDITGVRLMEAAGTGSASLTLSLGDLTPQVLILTVTAGGNAETFKIAR
ncbi:MAG: leucine-rich repeat domain-containing protein [Duncaniella sp.]|nr:leucine-rich repeat domain-containing protein [Duncaniella sp.]